MFTTHSPSILETLRSHDALAESAEVRTVMSDLKETLADVESVVAAQSAVAMLDALWELTNEVSGGRRVLAVADPTDSYMESCEIATGAYEELLGELIIHLPTIANSHRKAR